MKQIYKLLIAFLVLATILTSCSAQEKTPKANEVVESKTVESENSTRLKFTTKDFDGNTVTDEIFSKYDLTLVNVWGTFCGPCIAEMPDLGKVYNMYKDKNCNVLGLAADVILDQTPDTLELGKTILKDSNCNFKSLQMEDSLMNVFSMVTGVPTSFFVNNKGEIIPGSFHTGRMTAHEFIQLFEENLKKVK